MNETKPSKKNLNKKDLEDTRSIPFRQTLDLVSAFVVSTTEMMNKFAVNCEDKLNQVGDDLNRLETTLEILESKLNSIEGLESQTPTTISSTLPTTNETNETTTTETVPEVNDTDDAPSPPPPQVDENVLLCKNDPRLSVYFKMLRVGVPDVSIKDKMIAEGLDPNLLE
eukprot:gene3502-6150_t